MCTDCSILPLKPQLSPQMHNREITRGWLTSSIFSVCHYFFQSVCVFKSGGEYVISSCLFIAACGDAVEASLAQFVEQLRSKCIHTSVCVTRLHANWFAPANTDTHHNVNEWWLAHTVEESDLKNIISTNVCNKTVSFICSTYKQTTITDSQCCHLSWQAMLVWASSSALLLTLLTLLSPHS